MKTLKILLLVIGTLCINLGYASTVLNLPKGNINETIIDRLFVYGESALLTDIENLLQKNTESSNFEDTIIVDLDEIVITEGLSGNSKICIQKQITYPDFAVKQKLEGVVAVCIVFNHDGNVEITKSFSSSIDLENYVIEKLQHIHFSNCIVQIGKEYNLHFTFQLL